ncbi:hypothetical protein CRYUN_Cryun01aG0261400 [Craigia yunnanensis]
MVHELLFTFTEYELFNLLMKTAINKISITTDMWKSSQKIQYMVLTAHFVDLDWKLQKRVLSFVDVPHPHTRLIVYDALYKCLQKWGIKGKVSTITVDNAIYNDLAVKILQDSLSFHKSFPLKG